MTTPDPDDLTARARIRDAALRHFAEDGFARTTIRGIARTAGVSPGLVRHHFGSKDALRRTCDEHVLEISRRYNDQALDGTLPEPGFAGARAVLNPLQRYVARALVDGSPAAAALFEEMVGMSERWLRRQDADRPDPPIADARTRAVLLTAMTVGIPLLHEQVSRALDVDVFGAEGDRRVTLGMVDLFSRPVLGADLAAAVRAALDTTGATDTTDTTGAAGADPGTAATAGPAAPPSRGEAP